MKRHATLQDQRGQKNSAAEGDKANRRAIIQTVAIVSDMQVRRDYTYANPR